jgi:hypothetical protein
VLEIMKEGGGHSGGGQSVADMCETWGGGGELGSPHMTTFCRCKS